MPTTYRIAPFRGKPTLFINDKPDPSYLYCYPLSLDYEATEEIHRRFIDHGCRYFTVNVRGGVDNDWSTTPFWTDDGVFPDITDAAEVAANNLVRQATMIFKHAPDARLWIRYHCGLPKRYRQSNPDEMLLNSFGHRYDEPSLASDKTIEQLTRFVENIVRFVERQPFADRVVGYIVYPLGEGATVLTCEGYLFDQSPVMQRGFRGFLRRRYGTDGALRTAWNRPEISLESAAVPTDPDFHKRGETRYAEVVLDDRATTQPAPHRLHFPEPHETAPERDYCLFMRELTQRSFRALLAPVKRLAPNKLSAIDAFKQTMMGWPLIPRWAGDYRTHQGAQHPVTGAFGVAELLDMPELDAVATPHDYLHRGMGFGYEGEGIGDSIVLHNKMMLMEEDQRTFVVPENKRWNHLKDMPEIRAGLWRNLGSSVARGYNTYPMDICRPSFFLDDGIQQVLGDRRLVHEAATWWDRRDVPGIVMLIDDWSCLQEDFTNQFQYLSVIHQRLYGLSRCGVPFRLFLFDDLKREDFPTFHRVYHFPNLVTATPERIELIRRKLARDGNVLVWGPASGMSNGAALSAESATELTGIPLRLHRRESPRFVTVDRFEHPITARLSSRVDFGDSWPFGPILWPLEHAEVQRLGGIQWPHAFDGAGLVIREFGRGAAGSSSPAPRGAGDYASIFSAAVPLPDVLLREIARYAGAHVYHETDDILFADERTLTVHAVRPGHRRVALPRAADVWDLIGRKKIGSNLRAIEYDVAPPETRMFYLGSEDPFTAR